MFPGVFVTGRENGDPAGTVQSEVQLKAGEIAYTAFDGSPHRWGDYTGMTIDPNGSTFWYLGEYSKIEQQRAILEEFGVFEASTRWHEVNRGWNEVE